MLQCICFIVKQIGIVHGFLLLKHVYIYTLQQVLLFATDKNYNNQSLRSHRPYERCSIVYIIKFKVEIWGIQFGKITFGSYCTSQSVAYCITF